VVSGKSTVLHCQLSSDKKVANVNMNEESLATLERSGHSAAELYDQKCQNIPT